MRRIALALAAATLLSSSCTSERAGTCSVDADCAALIASGEIDAANVRCHPVARFCYPGCEKNEDCEGWRFGLWCDTQSGHCSDIEPDGGAADLGAE